MVLSFRTSLLRFNHPRLWRSAHRSLSMSGITSGHRCAHAAVHSGQSCCPRERLSVGVQFCQCEYEWRARSLIHAMEKLCISFFQGTRSRYFPDTEHSFARLYLLFKCDMS